MSRLFLLLLAAVALPAAAQYAQPADQNILYGVKKNQMPNPMQNQNQMPQGMVIEQGVANPGVPTSGTQQAQQLRRNQMQSGYGQPGYGAGGPNVIYRDRKDKGLTVITGPNGSTVCRDVNGHVTVCN